MIRPATLGDCSAIARLAVQLGYPATEQQVCQRLASFSLHREQVVFVAESAGEVIGWLHAHILQSLLADSPAEIAGLVVDERHRSSGVGKQLMEHAEEWAKSQGCALVRLRSNVKRARAHQFYERLGYTLWKSSHAFEKRLD